MADKNQEVIFLILASLMIVLSIVGMMLPEIGFVPKNLNDLQDVNFVSLQNGQILIYNSTTGNWSSGIILGVENLTDLNDVYITNLNNGQVLRFNSTFGKWQNVENTVLLSDSQPTANYSGIFWIDTTNNYLKVYNGSTWLNLKVYDSLLWNGNAFSDWLNQAVKTNSNPIFSSLTLNGKIFFGADDGIPNEGSMFQQSTVGLVIYPHEGSTFDFIVNNKNGDGVLSIATGTRNIVIYGDLKTGGYKSSDGTTGLTQDVVVLTALPSTFITMHFKDGLFVGTT